MTKELRAEDTLAERIQIRSILQLIEVAVSLREYIDRGQLKQVGGNFKIEDLTFKTYIHPSDVLLEFETIPGKTRYVLKCWTEWIFGGLFESLPRRWLMGQNPLLMNHVPVGPERLHAFVTDVQSLLREGKLREVSGPCAFSEIQTDVFSPLKPVAFVFEAVGEGTRYRLTWEQDRYEYPTPVFWERLL